MICHRNGSWMYCVWILVTIAFSLDLTACQFVPELRTLRPTTAPLRTTTEDLDSCGFNATVTDEPVSITSPGWPSFYPNSHMCVWYFRASNPGASVQVRFLSFDTELRWDVVQGFIDGVLAFSYSGDDVPPSFVSTSNLLRIVFRSDTSVPMRGFQATIREVPRPPQVTPPPPCAFTLNVSDMPNLLSTPLHPEPYANELECVWELISPPDTRILVTFHTFRTETCCDVLTILENDILAGRFAGLLDPFRYLSTTNQIEMRFRSDGSVFLEGFNASFVAVDLKPPVPSDQVAIVDGALENIQQYTPYIQASYSDWYTYRYDGGPENSFIDDGGFDMFDNGNNILISNNDGEEFEIEYNEVYGYSNLVFKSQAESPFVALIWVNNHTTNANYTIEVSGNPGADGNGRTETSNGTIIYRDFTLLYSVFQLFGARTDPTICEVYFSIHSFTEWNSTFIIPIEVEFFGNNNILRTTVTIFAGEDQLQNVMVGYTLLSRHPTSALQNSEVEVVLQRMLEAILDEVPTTIEPLETTTEEGSVITLPITTAPTTTASRITGGCILARCVNAFNCIDGFFSYTCECNPGWGGKNCDIRSPRITATTVSRITTSAPTTESITISATTPSSTTPITATTTVTTTTADTAATTTTTTTTTAATTTAAAAATTTTITTAYFTDTAVAAATTTTPFGSTTLDERGLNNNITLTRSTPRSNNIKISSPVPTSPTTASTITTTAAPTTATTSSATSWKHQHTNYALLLLSLLFCHLHMYNIILS